MKSLRCSLVTSFFTLQFAGPAAEHEALPHHKWRYSQVFSENKAKALSFSVLFFIEVIACNCEPCSLLQPAKDATCVVHCEMTLALFIINVDGSGCLKNLTAVLTQCVFLYFILKHWGLLGAVFLQTCAPFSGCVVPSHLQEKLLCISSAWWNELCSLALRGSVAAGQCSGVAWKDGRVQTG